MFAHKACSQMKPNHASVPVVPENESERLFWMGKCKDVLSAVIPNANALALSTYGDTVISLLSSGFLPITSQEGQVRSCEDFSLQRLCLKGLDHLIMTCGVKLCACVFQVTCDLFQHPGDRHFIRPFVRTYRLS